jgi:hypothetical protein
MGPETVGALVTFLHAERDERIDRSRAASWNERGAKSGHREYGEDPGVDRWIRPGTPKSASGNMLKRRSATSASK